VNTDLFIAANYKVKTVVKTSIIQAQSKLFFYCRLPFCKSSFYPL